jgi:hypothetical protein
MMKIDAKEIERRFTFNPPNEERANYHKLINEEVKSLAYRILDLTPEGREQSLALTALEEVRMRANQAIATGPKE